MTKPGYMGGGVTPSEYDFHDWDEEAEREFYDSLPCQFCEEGFVVACVDDLCRANGGCMNMGRTVREGCYRVCPHCKGNWQ